MCVKQVPDTANVEVDPVTGVLKRDGAQSKLNPYDLYAMESSLGMKERRMGAVLSLIHIYRLPASLRTFFVAWAISLAATLNSSLLEEREM